MGWDVVMNFCRAIMVDAWPVGPTIYHKKQRIGNKI